MVTEAPLGEPGLEVLGDERERGVRSGRRRV
jgi:hypothetical protein